MIATYSIKTSDGKTNYVVASSKKAALAKISRRYPMAGQIVSISKCNEA